jgi:hypothetical protein
MAQTLISEVKYAQNPKTGCYCSGPLPGPFTAKQPSGVTVMDQELKDALAKMYTFIGYGRRSTYSRQDSQLEDLQTPGQGQQNLISSGA